MVNSIIAENIDYLTFALLTLCVVTGTAAFLRRRRAPFPAASLLLIAGVLACGWPIVHRAGRIEHESSFSILSGYAATYATEFELMGHAQLGMNPQPDDPLYLRLINAEIRWQKANPVVSDIYTMRRLEDGTVVFLVDSETDYDKNGMYSGEKESRTTPGEINADPSDGLQKAFGGLTTFTEPFTDRWGTWVSVNVPMRDAEGKVEAVLGVDYPAQRWQSLVARARLGVIGFVGLILLTLLGSGSAAAILRARVEEEVASATQLEEGRRELLILNQQLSELSMTDGLTGVRNRRAFDQALKAELAKANRLKVPISLLMIDIDLFKSFNDVFGHQAGDEALKGVARVLERNARLYDFVARYGGEEFAVILSGANHDEARAAGERLRAAIERAEWPHRPITISVGSSTADPEKSVDDLIASADAALYRAKEGGRNRVA